MTMKPHVLIVEDEAPLQQLLAYNLERAGFTVDQALNSDEAMTRLAERPPDLILLDWMLPSVSGIEVCRQVKSKSDTRGIPIIMLSARSEEVDRVRGRSFALDREGRRRPAGKLSHPPGREDCVEARDQTRIVAALRFALAAHGPQTRKGGPIPYASHLLQVAGLGLEAGGDASQAAAALLHDTLEDCENVDVVALRERFDADVTSIVEACTDTLPGDAPGAKAPWSERKTRHLERLARAPAEARPDGRGAGEPPHVDVGGGDGRLARLGATGAVMAAGTLGGLTFGIGTGSEDHALALAFTTFVLFQVFNALCARSETASVFGRDTLRNAKLWAALGVVVALQVEHGVAPTVGWRGARQPVHGSQTDCRR